MGVAGAPLVTGFILAEYDWRLAFIIPGILSPDRFGVSEFDAERKSRISRSGIEGKSRSRFRTGLAAGVGFSGDGYCRRGFVFGAMTFLVPRLFEVRMLGVSTDIAVTEPSPQWCMR